MTNPDSWSDRLAQPPDTWNEAVQVYDLRDNQGELSGTQEYLRRYPPPENTAALAHGAIGSPEWWHALESGEIPLDHQQFLITGKEWGDGARMSELVLVYDIVEAGKQDTWDHPYECPEFDPGDWVRVDYVTFGPYTKIIAAIWKQSPDAGTLSASPALSEYDLPSIDGNKPAGF